MIPCSPKTTLIQAFPPTSPHLPLSLTSHLPSPPSSPHLPLPLTSLFPSPPLTSLFPSPPSSPHLPLPLTSHLPSPPSFPHLPPHLTLLPSPSPFNTFTSESFSTTAGKAHKADFLPNTVALAASSPTMDSFAFMTWKLLSFQPGFFSSTLTNRSDFISEGVMASTN